MSGVVGILYLILAKVAFPYVSACSLHTSPYLYVSPSECAIIADKISMESTEEIESKKRNIGMVAAQNLMGQFRSKQDFVVHLGQNRKCHAFLHLTHL